MECQPETGRVKCLEFTIDEDSIIVTISIKLSIREFLGHVKDIYEYAVHYSGRITQDKAKQIMQDNRDTNDEH